MMKKQINGCRLCNGQIRGWDYKLIGCCAKCYELSFQVRKNTLPPLRCQMKGGWEKLLSHAQLVDQIIKANEGMEAVFYSPDFYEEWLDMVKEIPYLRPGFRRNEKD